MERGSRTWAVVDGDVNGDRTATLCPVFSADLFGFPQIIIYMDCAVQRNRFKVNLWWGWHLFLNSTDGTGPWSSTLLPVCKFRTCLEFNPGSAWAELVSTPRVHAELCAQTGRRGPGWEVRSGELCHLVLETNVCTRSFRKLWSCIVKNG